MKMVKVCGLIVSAWVATTVQASDTKIQIFEVTCRDFLLAESDEVDLINIFHLGYLAGTQKRREVDIDQMSLLSANVKAHCVDHPDALLVETFAKIGKQ